MASAASTLERATEDRTAYSFPIDPASERLAVTRGSEGLGVSHRIEIQKPGQASVQDLGSNYFLARLRRG